MTVQVEIDGIPQTLEFPDGTDPVVIQNTVKQLLAAKQTEVSKSPTQLVDQKMSESIEVIENLGGSFLGEVAGGLRAGAEALIGTSPLGIATGLTEPPSMGRAIETFKSTKEFFDRPVKSEGAKQSLETLGNIVKSALDAINIPIAKTAEVVELITGQSPEQAEQVSKDIKEKGFPTVFGLSVAEKTGNDLLGALAFALPSAVMEIGFARGAKPAGIEAIKPIEEAVKRAANKPEIRVFDNNGFTPEAMLELKRLEESGLTGVNILTVEQAERFNLFARRNVPALKADVTRKTTDSVNQQESLKKTGAVSETVAAQDKRLIQLTEEQIDKIGPAASDLSGANASVFAAVDDLVTELDNAVGAAYRQAQTQAVGQPRVSLENLLEAIKNNRGRESFTGGVISNTVQTLRNKGLFKKGKDIDINKRGSRKAETKKLTVKEAEEIRQDLNAAFADANPAGRRLIRELKDALDDDVARAVGEDIFVDARAAKVKMQSIIERQRRDKRDIRKGSFLEDVINNKIEAPQIITKLLQPGTRVDDFLKFKQFLTEEAGELGKQAWLDIKAEVLREALTKATSTQIIREGGQLTFNIGKFRTALKPIRSGRGKQKFNELFSPAERQLISDIESIGNLRLPIDKTISGEGPTALAVGKIREIILSRIPVIGGEGQSMLDAVLARARDKDLLEFTKQTEKALAR